MHAILAIFAMVERPTEDDNFAAYRARFGVPDDAATFGNFLVDMAAATKLQDVGSNMTCSVCYNIHGGASGDCSSVFGCNNELCNFCTNHATCSDCWKLHQGATGSCCALAGCDSKLCSFCTNPDWSPSSCPPPGPPPPPPPPTPTPTGCPGGTLKACIPLCPDTPCAAFQICTKNCLSKCA